MQRPAYASLWFYLLTNASVYGNEQFIFNGKQTSLKPGQLIVGAYKLSKEIGVPRGTIERILKVLKNEEQIEIQPTNKYSIITIVNWKKYQGGEEQNEELVRNKRGTDEDNKEDKIEKKILQPKVAKEIIPFKQLKEDKNRHIQIIGLYWEYLGIKFDNYEQQQAQLRRNLKGAKNLIGYTDEQILNTMRNLDKITNFGKKNFKWTLETILKYISE